MAVAGGQRQHGVRLGYADEHIVEYPAVGEEFLSETVVVRTGHRSSLGSVRTAWQA
jgi:hypothetical protein